MVVVASQGGVEAGQRGGWLWAGVAPHSVAWHGTGKVVTKRTDAWVTVFGSSRLPSEGRPCWEISVDRKSVVERSRVGRVAGGAPTLEVRRSQPVRQTGLAP